MCKFNKNLKKSISLFCILVLSFISLGMSKPNTIEKKKIFKNIYIEEINIGGMTKEQCKQELYKVYKIEPIIIKYNDRVFNIKPEDINLYYDYDGCLDKAFDYTHSENNYENFKRIFSLAFKNEYKINLETHYNEIELSEIIRNIATDINVEVKNATIDINDSGEIIRTDSKEGLEVDVIKLKECIYDMIVSHKIQTIDLPVKVIKPNITTEDVKSINTVLGQYSTSFNEYSARGSNIHVASLSTSEKLIMPQEIFSYNNTTGYRSWSNGYKTAKVIVGGKYVNGEGGGVCQVSTTIYNAALLSGMQIEEVHNHTFQSHYAPRGRDAAVSYGYTDLKFKNGYAHPIYIKNIVNNGAITSKIYGCSQDREKLYIKTEEKYSNDKIDVKTFRVYLDEENNKIREELIANSKYKIH